MKPHAVLITGMCRSGGAALAQVVMRLGWPTGITFASPVAPHWRLDCEDNELTTFLAAAVEGKADDLFFDFGEYVDRRIEHSQVYGFEGRIGFKSPLLTLMHGPLLEVLAERGMPYVTLISKRDPEAIDASIAHFGKGSDTLRRWNGKIRQKAFAGGRNAKAVAYEALVGDTETTVRSIAAHLGVDDPGRIASAVECVLQPTAARS